MGGDPRIRGTFGSRWQNFNPRPPHGGRRQLSLIMIILTQFQSTPPAWGATRGRHAHRAFGSISIHAPRMGGDLSNDSKRSDWAQISIHAPRMGGDITSHVIAPPVADFNPRPPHGGRLIHIRKSVYYEGFQSTPPAWGATCTPVPAGFFSAISIHAPRMGGDRVFLDGVPQGGDFNPRPPHGGRHGHLAHTISGSDFNPRPPHGGRLSSSSLGDSPAHFNPRPPHGGRRSLGTGQGGAITFQSTPPAWGATLLKDRRHKASKDFNPRPPHGGRLCPHL